MGKPILVTGATGKLGSAICRALIDHGHSIRATDRRFVKDHPARVELGDLCDEIFVQRVVEGCDAVVHLGNHPNSFAGPSPSKLLAENVAMNANVFSAAVDRGIKTIVFSSSVQVMVKRAWPVKRSTFELPYLPLDGNAPTNPGSNTYALSKEIAERMLRLAVDEDPALSATSIRYPMLVTDWLVKRMTAPKRVPLEWIDFAECTAHLYMADAAELCAAVLARRSPGYHQYFPALTMELRGYSLADMVRERYPNVALRRPIDEIAHAQGLIDLSAITRETGWEPRERLSIEVDH